ncbi:hypothetical protein [Orenia marismortui]|nr:hypothetical protein [Orenia marismortui]
MATYYKFKDNKIPTFEELLGYGSEDTYVNIFIYIFEDVITDKEKKEEFLSNVMELLEYLRGQNLKWATIQISIYDEEFFKDKDMDHVLEVSGWFHNGTDEFDVWEYKEKLRYNLLIFKQKYKTIEEKRDIEELINMVYPE